MMARKINDKDVLIFWRGAVIPRVTKVDNQTKTFKCNLFEKITRPNLEQICR